MQLNKSLLCIVVGLLLLCFSPVCPSKHSKSRHTQIHQKTHGTKKFCDPSFSNQTAGAITQSTVQLSVSMQKCSSGFYREQTGPHRGQCVPCSCNGLSNECDEHTGNCVNCQFNAAGARCERCKEGHYGNAAKRTCRACPCPLTGNNFALACLDIGPSVECLCKRGYIGARCERCAFGYYGNPMMDGGSCKPCKCKDENICDSLTGECITSCHSSSGHPCHDCDSCVVTSLFDLQQMDGILARLKQQLQNFTHEPASLSGLNHLQASVSKTKVQLMQIAVGGYSSAVRHLDRKVEQLEADVDAIRDDFSRLITEVPEMHEGVSYLENVFQDANGTKLKAEDLEAEALLREIHDLMKRRTEANPAQPVTLSDDTKAGMMEEAQHIMQEMRARGCSAQRGEAGREQEEANTLLDVIWNLAAPVQTHQTVLNETADSLMDSSLREMAELLSDAEDKVDRMRGLNLRSRTVLQQLEHLHTQLETEQSTLPRVTEMTKDVLKNTTEMFLILEEIKKEFENHAAQINGAKPELMKLNILQIMEKVDIVTKAEEHAEELNGMAAEFQQLLHDAIGSTHLHVGTYNNILNAIEKADVAANESREAADQVLKDVKAGDLENRAGAIKDSSTQLKANETQSDLKMLSHTVNIHKHRAGKQKEKRESLRTDISAFSDDIKQIRRDDTRVLIESAKSAASASNSTASDITERLSSISQEVHRITSTNVSVNMLIDAGRALKNLTAALPALKGKIVRVEALSGSKPGGDLTDVIWMIKDVIEEARTYINRVPVAAIFNGKGHVELRPPKNLEDMKAFAAIELFLNRHQNNRPKADNRRKRRQDRRRDASFFVFYLGNKNASGDYVGMAIRNNVLVCVYKLGGVVHEVKTSTITTTTSVNSTDFDIVHFFRVYQDAQVDVIRSGVPFVSKHLLPNSSYNILKLDPDGVVLYVGGYPKNFTPPVELRYNKYRGAMQMTTVNDNPVCLFNYKHAENMGPKQPLVMVRRGWEASDYYDGTGYRMAFTKGPHEIRRRLYKFDMKSREPDALLFYIGTEETFFCVFVERGFLVLQGQQAGRKIKLQSLEKVPLHEKRVAIAVADTFIVVCGPTQLSTEHVPTNYTSYYIGGLPARLRQRHNITAPPLRGCVSHLTEDAEFVTYNKTIGVTGGCPNLAQSIRSATLYSPLPVHSLFDRGEQSLRVSVGFKSTDTHGVFLRSGSRGSTSVHDLQLSLADGHAVFSSDNYTVRSDKRYNDGNWHYLSAVRRPTWLELSIDDIKVTLGQSNDSRSLDHDMQRGSFTGCITNLYTRRPNQQFLPADLSLLSLSEDVVLGRCSLHPPSQTEVSPTKKPQKHKALQAPAGSQCKRRQAQHGEYQLSGEHSWLGYNLPQQDLNYRPHFSLDIKTNSSKGLILHMAGRGVVPLLALYLANGKIRMSLGQSRTILHKQKSNDGNWHRVQLSVEKSTFHLLVDGVRVTDGHLPDDAGSSLDFHNPVYLGGDPMSKTTKGHSVPVNSVVGCVRDFKLNDEDVGEPEASHVTSPCFDRFTETGTFFGGGHVILDDYFTIGSQFELAFELRPQYLTGLLFHVQNHKISLDVFLMETEVGVEINDGAGPVRLSVTPPESLCDGKFHVITVSKQSELITLTVDSMFEQRALSSTSYATALNSLYIGGTTNQNRVSVSSPFIGCLRNVNLNGRPVVFETGYRLFGSVSINRCPAD